MSTTIVHDIRFESAHHLPNTPIGHRCRNLHGHSYVCEVHVTGPVNYKTGFICDFAEIDDACQSILAKLDHRLLNDVPGLENPTSENIVHFIWQELAPKIKGLCTLVLHETSTSRCIYTGPSP